MPKANEPKGPGGPKSPKSPDGPGRQGGTQVLERTRTKKPRMWKVVMHNDDYTTQEFVVHVLVDHFRKDPTTATQLMLRVHTSGLAVVGAYPKDIAETKVAVVTDLAREMGHPLLLTCEPESQGDDE